MKVFLVVPRCLNPKQTYQEYPLGVGLIATALRQQGTQVVIYDQSVEGPDDDLLMSRLAEFGPEVVGFSVITPSYTVAQRQIRRIRQECRGVTIVAGGIHASLFPEDLLSDGADVVGLGEGCRMMTALVQCIGDGRSWETLPGAAYRDREGRFLRTRNVRRSVGEDPGIIDRDVYNLPRYTHHSMLASLGCPYRCTFCSNYTGTVLQDGVTIRSYDCILEEMQYLAERYGADRVFFADDVFLLRRSNVLAFCRRLRRERLRMQWIAQMRVDTIDAEVAEAMAAADCRRIYFGIESGSDAILQRVRKGIDRESIRLGVRSAKGAGMRVKTGWVFGLPGSLEEQYESVAFMRELRPHEISIHQLVPFPGTEYYNRPAEHGVRIRDPKDFSSFCYGGLGDNVSFDYLPRRELIELLQYTVGVLEAEGYVSSDRATAQDEYVFSTPLNTQSLSVFHAGG